QIAVGAAAVYGLGFAALEPIWWFAAAGYAMVNSALVTGLEFENFHWAYVACPFGAVLVLGAAVLAIDHWWPRNRRGLAAVAIVPAVDLAVGTGWRAYQALNAPRTLWTHRALVEFLPLRDELAALGPEDVLVGPSPAQVALLLTRSGMLYQAHQSVIS